MRHRIKEIRKALGLNQKEFAKQIGLTQTSLSMIEVGENAFTEKNVKLICVTFNVSEQWLRTGKGQMFNSSPYVKEITDIMENLTPDTQQYLLLMAQELLSVQEKLLHRTDKDNAPPSED
jgi:DNA-binding XRE family transcriptional regulator